MKIKAKMNVTRYVDGRKIFSGAQVCDIEIVEKGVYIYYKDDDFWVDEADNMNCVRVSFDTTDDWWDNGDTLTYEYTNYNGKHFITEFEGAE